MQQQQLRSHQLRSHLVLVLERRVEKLQLQVDRAEVAHRVGARAVNHMHEHAAALHVPKELVPAYRHTHTFVRLLPRLIRMHPLPHVHTHTPMRRRACRVSASGPSRKRACKLERLQQ
eukprot:10633-Chlamydomonas_euryale.AAC.1